MAMRVSDAFSQRIFLRDLQRVNSRLDEALARVSSGKRVRFASDDPQAAAELVRIADESRDLTARRQALSLVRPWLQQTERALTDISEGLRTAQTQAIAASNGTVTGANMQAVATQIEGIRSELRKLANTQISGRYIFSGTAFTTPPFDANGTYQGNQESFEVALDGERLPLNFPGDVVFGEEGVGGPLAILEDLETALRAGDRAGVQATLDGLEQAIADNSTLLARIGNRSKSLEDADFRLQDKQLATASRASDLGAADMAEAISDVQRFQTGYQATLAAGARVFGPTFFDYLG